MLTHKLVNAHFLNLKKSETITVKGGKKREGGISYQFKLKYFESKTELGVYRNFISKVVEFDS